MVCCLQVFLRRRRNVALAELTQRWVKGSAGHVPHHVEHVSHMSKQSGLIRSGGNGSDQSEFNFFLRLPIGQFTDFSSRTGPLCGDRAEYMQHKLPARVLKFNSCPCPRLCTPDSLSLSSLVPTCKLRYGLQATSGRSSASSGAYSRAPGNREQQQTSTGSRAAASFLQYFATCHPGLELALKTELQDNKIGAFAVEEGFSGVSFRLIPLYYQWA